MKNLLSIYICAIVKVEKIILVVVKALFFLLIFDSVACTPACVNLGKLWMTAGAERRKKKSAKTFVLCTFHTTIESTRKLPPSGYMPLQDIQSGW